MWLGATTYYWKNTTKLQWGSKTRSAYTCRPRCRQPHFSGQPRRCWRMSATWWSIPRSQSTGASRCAPVAKRLLRSVPTFITPLHVSLYCLVRGAGWQRALQVGDGQPAPRHRVHGGSGLQTHHGGQRGGADILTLLNTSSAPCLQSNEMLTFCLPALLLHQHSSRGCRLLTPLDRRSGSDTFARPTAASTAATLPPAIKSVPAGFVACS